MEGNDNKNGITKSFFINRRYSDSIFKIGMDYTVMGKVVNMRQEPLEGIKIKPRWDKWPLDSTYTDSQGTFVVVRKGGALEWKSDTFYYAPLIVEDTAGVYYKDTVYIKMVQIKEGDGWYRGEFESKDAKITMRK